MKKERQIAIQDLAEQIAPVISEQIQETIAWQTDGHEYAESLTGDEYLKFVNELQNEIIKNLL
jgi:hypothetical protein